MKTNSSLEFYKCFINSNVPFKVQCSWNVSPNDIQHVSDFIEFVIISTVL